MADEYDNEAFEPDHAAENSVLRSQLQSLQLQLQTAQQAAESAETALRALRVAGRRQKPADDTDSRRVDACDDDTASAALIETPFTSIELQGEQMANGGFGAVHKAHWHGATVAVKKLFDPLITDELRAEFRTEVRILSRLRHPNIVQFLACCSKPPNLCIVMEWMARGSLYHVLHNSAVEMGRERQLSLMRQIAAGLEYLHSLDIVHNDIKAANILVDEYFRAKLCDFGLARPVATLRQQVPQGGGTPNYLAPEIWNKQSASKASDVYALGILFAEIVSREVPFDGVEPLVIRDRVLQEKRMPLPSSCSASVKALIEKCWSHDPQKRPSALQVLMVLKVCVKDCH